MEEDNKRSRFKSELKLMTLDQLNYVLARYCGPHNVLLREKTYGHALAKDVKQLVCDEIAMREFDKLLLDDND